MISPRIAANVKKRAIAEGTVGSFSTLYGKRWYDPIDMIPPHSVQLFSIVALNCYSCIGIEIQEDGIQLGTKLTNFMSSNLIKGTSGNELVNQEQQRSLLQ